MSEYFASDLRSEVSGAHETRTRRTLRVGDQIVPILRFWDNGFAVDIEELPPARGRVDLFEGDRHVSRALVMQSREEGGERIFEVKFATPVSDRAPVVDFVSEPFLGRALAE